MEKSYRALIIGINYLGTKNQLSGCINDANYIYQHLLENYPITKDDIRLITDETKPKPKLKHVKAGMLWLCEGANENSKLFLHYSGHGTQFEDFGSEESDGKDECIYVLDGVMRDDDIQMYLFNHLPNEATLTTIFDCCHAGTMLDLSTVNQQLPLIDDDTAQMCFYCSALTKCIPKRKKSLNKQNKQVICISGCRDDQSSYEFREETKHNSEYRGVLTYHILKLLNNNPGITYHDFMDLLTKKITNRKHGKQIPQIIYTGSPNLDMPMKLL